jgi:hypothetical protein
VKRFIRLFTVLVATLVVTMPLEAIPAHALAGTVAGEFEGSGTISPGLTTTPTSQSWSLSGTLAWAGSVDTGLGAGTASCSFGGGSTSPESVATGTVTMSGSCSGGTVGSFSCTCTLTITRVGCCWLITLRCTICINGHCITFTVIIRLCMLPTSTSPVTSYLVLGEVVGAGT